MQEALRKTVLLLRTHPALLVPLVAATWGTFYLEWFQKAATHFVLHRFLIGHSVLGFSIPMPDPTYTYVHKAMLVMLPFELTMRVLILGVYIAGFVLTARLVREIHIGHNLNWKSAAHALQKRALRVLGVSVLLLALFSASSMLVSVCVENMALIRNLRDRISAAELVGATMLLVMMMLAWSLIPTALRMVVENRAAAISPKRKLHARMAAIAAAALAMALYAFIRIETPNINFAFKDALLLRNHLLWPAIFTLGNLPMGLLWIFLGRLAFEDLENVNVLSAS